jgi:hypothetical protein
MLKPEAGRGSQRWFMAHLAGVICLVLGAASFATVALVTGDIRRVPDWHLTLPFFVAAVGAAGVSFGRRERAYAMPLLGVGLAAGAMVLGYFVLLAAVLVVTGLLILVMSHLM